MEERERGRKREIRLAREFFFEISDIKGGTKLRLKHGIKVGGEAEPGTLLGQTMEQQFGTKCGKLFS